MIVGIWVVMIFIALIQLPPVIQEKQWGELIVFIGLWIIAGAYASIVIGLDDGGFLIPNHTEVVHTVVTRIYAWIGL